MDLHFVVHTKTAYDLLQYRSCIGYSLDSQNCPYFGNSRFDILWNWISLNDAKHIKPSKMKCLLRYNISHRNIIFWGSLRFYTAKNLTLYTRFIPHYFFEKNCTTLLFYWGEIFCTIKQDVAYLIKIKHFTIFYFRRCFHHVRGFLIKLNYIWNTLKAK